MGKRLRSEGMPQEPAIYFDEVHRRATVRGKVKSIRSILRSDRLWALFCLIGLPFIACNAWQLTAESSASDQDRVVITICMMVVAGLGCRCCLFPMLNIHGKRSEVAIEFTSEWIYGGGKKQRRVENGVPLSVGCRVGRDATAEARLATHQHSRERAHEFAQSRALTLLVQHPRMSAFTQDCPVAGGRIVELTTIIGEQEAFDFATVCQVALALTAPEDASARTVNIPEIDDQDI